MICFSHCAPIGQFFIVVSMIVSIIVSILSMIVLRLTLDRRVRRVLPKDKIYNSYMDAYFGVGRAISFGAACVFRFANDSEKLRYYYNNIDIKAFANRFEKFVAYCMYISGAILILSGIIIYATDWLGIYNWPDK